MNSNRGIGIELLSGCVPVVIGDVRGVLCAGLSGRRNALFLCFIFCRQFSGHLLNWPHPGRFRNCVCLRVVGVVNSGGPRSVSVEIFRKCAPVVSTGHGNLHLFFRLRCGGVLCPGRVGEGGFRCVFTPGMFFCLRALVVSGGGRGIFFTGISGSHRGIFFSGIGSGNNVLVWFIFCGRFSGCLLHGLHPGRFRKRSCFCCVAVVSGVCTCGVCIEVFLVASGSRRGILCAGISGRRNILQWFIRG